MDEATQTAYENDRLVRYNIITEEMAIDEMQQESTLTKNRMNMVYRTYTLHPHVDDYFYYNYPHYKTVPLVQTAHYLADCNKKDLTGFTISTTIPITGNICTDIYIKFGHLHSACIKSIHIYVNGYRTDRGIYNMDWLTIYLYNMRYHPDMFLRNIFILPNLTLLASTLYSYTMDIIFDHNTLYENVFEPWRRTIAKYMPPDVGSQIMKYVPNHILIDIWGRTDLYEKNNSQAVHSQIFSILRTSFRSIYMTNYLLDCNSDRVISLNIHKNMMHNNILFSYLCRDSAGNWVPMFQFNKLTMHIDNIEHTIMEHEMTILPCLYKTHYVKMIKPIKEYSMPSKFILTNNITNTGSHPYMYSLQLGDHIDHSLIMGNDEDDSNNVITLIFMRNHPVPNTYLYVELSTK